MNSQIGLIGLAVMGQNLARNIANKGYKIAVYNRTTSKMKDFIEQYGNTYLTGEAELSDFIAQIERPRKIILMVKAGAGVEDVINQLLSFIEEGDIIIDAGNSNFHDTIRRYKELKDNGISFMGCGVSGGEEGALHGPSLMPGGDQRSWELIRPVLEKISARDFGGGACVTYIGDNGAGHYVKMVHNGIEYAVMQMIAESYQILTKIYHLNPPQIADIFQKYNQGVLNSYLFQIAVPVLRRKDEFNEGYLIDYIKDQAGQKGTGRWTAMDGLQNGIAIPSITEAVHARMISSQKNLRVKLNNCFQSIELNNSDLHKFILQLEKGLYAAMLSAYAQGYALINQAAQKYNWKIDLAELSRIWEGGCIIRAKILNFIHNAYSKEKDRSLHLFTVPEIKQSLRETIPALREVCGEALRNGLPIFSLGTALNYFDAMVQNRGSANLIQGLRDYFGAHTYERTDREGIFHTEWME